MATAGEHAGSRPTSRSSTGHSSTAAAAVRRAAHAYLDFALADPDLYQLMYGLGGVRVPATDAWNEGQAVGEVMTRLLAAAGDTQPEQHVLQLWATAHGLIALQVVDRVDVDPAGLHALFEDALTDRCLPRSASRVDTACWTRTASETLDIGRQLKPSGAWSTWWWGQAALGR